MAIAKTFSGGTDETTFYNLLISKKVVNAHDFQLASVTYVDASGTAAFKSIRGRYWHRFKSTDRPGGYQLDKIYRV